jgi:hypothetical protein
MAANTAPIFILKPFRRHVIVSVAAVFSPIFVVASADGGLLQRVTIQGIGTTVAALLQLAWRPTAAGSFFVWHEEPIAAIVPSPTVQAFRRVLTPDDLPQLNMPLEAGNEISAAVTVLTAGGISVFTDHGEFS